MKKLIALILALVMVFALAACGKSAETGKTETAGTAAPAAEGAVEPIVLKMANSNTTAMWNDTELDLMAAEKYFIEQLPIVTEGRYEVKIFLDGQLAGTTSEQIQGIKSGDFDIVEMGTGSMGEFSNGFAEVNVPYIFKNQDVADKVLSSDYGMSMFQRVCDDIGGVVPLYYSDNGFRLLTHSDKLIKSPADLKGVKIRVQPDEVMVKTFEALGANVVTVPYSELFTALQQKLVDAQENPATNLYNAKLYEVQKTCTITNHMFTAFGYIMNADKFNAMSPEDQEAVRKLSKECFEIRAEKMRNATDYYMKLLEDEGLEFYTPTVEEMNMFSDAMKDDVWPMCEQIMGTERWNALQEAVAAAETELGLR